MRPNSTLAPTWIAYREAKDPPMQRLQRRDIVEQQNLLPGI